MPDSVFVGWGGARGAWALPTCEVTMEQTMSVSAMFRGPQRLW